MLEVLAHYIYLRTGTRSKANCRSRCWLHRHLSNPEAGPPSQSLSACARRATGGSPLTPHPTPHPCASVQKRPWHRFQGSATVVTAVRQFREHAQASRNGPGTDFRAPRPLSRPFGNFASMRKRPETALAPISGLRDRCHGRSAISRACASVQKRPWHRFQGSATVVTAVRQFREHAQASRNGPGTDFRAPRPLSRPFGNFASMRKRPETALAPISGLRDRCHGRSAISRACASVQKRPWHRFQGSATVVTAVRQFREHAQASRNGPGTDFRAPRPLSRPFGNFASMRKRPETALAPISGLRDRCHGRSAISRACASVQKRPWHRFQGSATVVTAVRQFREHAQASRNGPGTDFRAPRPLSRPFGNFASMRKRPETALAPISGLRDRCHGRSAISRACASVQKRPWHRFQGSATVVTAVRQFREHAQASRNGPGTDFRAPRPLSRPFGNFASMRKRPETALAPISGLRDRCHGRSAISRACASVQKRPWHRFQGSATVVTAVRQFREHAQASRNGPGTDFRAPRPLSRPFGNFASMRKRPETALAPISGLRDRCHGRSAISRACASVQKRPWHRFQGSATVVTAVRQFREHAQASRNGPGTDFRAPRPLSRPFGNFASMRKRPETALAPISGLRDRCHGRSAISRACASVQKRPWHRFQGSATVVTAVRQFREHAQASRNGPGTDFRAPRPLSRPFGNFASMRKRPETALAPISGLRDRCHGRSAISRACASVQKRPWHRFQGSATVVTAVRQFREHAQASRNGPGTDFRAPRPLSRPFGNFASMRKRPETALAPISGLRDRCHGRSAISRACASVQKRPWHRFQGSATVVTAVRQFREHAQASRNGPGTDFRAPRPLSRPFGNFASMRKRPETALAPISGLRDRCHGRSAISRACASVQKRPWHRFQGSATVVTAVRQFREHAQASRNGPGTDFRAPRPLSRPFGNFASMRKRPETALAPISGLRDRCHGRSAISRACASVQKRPWHRFQGSATVVTAVRQFREHAQASRNGPGTDFRAPRPLSRPFGNFASMRKRPETALAPISGLRDRCHGRSAISRACASVQKRPWHRFQGSATVVTAVRQFREHAQASRNGPGTDFRAPRPLSRPFGNFASMRKRPETALAPISGLRDRCHGRSAISRACASVQKRPWHRFQGSATVVTAVRQFREHAQASRNGPGTDFRAPRPLSRPFGNFASMRKRPETALAPISGLRDRCHGRSAISRACASVQKRPWHRFQGSATVVTAVRQFREHAQASRNGPGTDFRAPRPLSRPFGNFASMRKRPETALAPISGLRDRCHGRSAISRACASVQKRPWHRFQGSATVVTAVRQFREHAQASRNGPGTDFRAPRPLSRPFGNFASMRKRPETALAPISGLRDRCHGRSAISRACASVQKRPWHRFQGSATVVTAVRQFREHAQASRNGPGTDFRAPRPLSRPFGNFASMRKRPETALAPISGLRDRCHGRSAISRACASVQKRPWHRFQGSATVVTAVRQFREHAQASRNGPGTDFRAPRPLSRPFGNFASMRKRPETALAPISGLRDRCHGRSAISRACASVQKRPWHRFQGSATVVTAVRQFREHAQASRNGPGTDFRAPRPLSRPFGNFASMRKRPETALAPISGLRDRCHGRSAISRACASVQKRPWHRFQGSATVVTAVRQFREHAQASRNGPGTDFRAPRPLSRPFGNFASMRKRPETALAPISGLRDRCHGRSAISRACASVQKRPWHRFQGSATVVTAVRQFREHAQASRNGPGTDFRAPRPLSRPFGNFASMRKRPETALAPISGLRDRCHGRSAISRACASVQKRPWHRFQGSATVVTAVRQFREHAQASRNGPGTDFRAPRPLSRPFGNFASMRKRPETALAPISGLRDRCHGRSAISRACASVQKRPWHRFQGSATVVTAVRQFREHAQASRNGPGTDFRAPRPLSRPFGNFASMRKRPETALAPISGLRDRCHGRSAISRACASVQKRPWHRFQGSATVVTAVRQFREHAQASRNGPGTDFRAPRPLSRPFGNFASMRKRPETALAPISGLRDRCHGRSAISRACASVQKRPWHRFQGSATVVTAVRQFREHAQASRNGPGTDFRAPRPLSRPFGNFASMRKRPETALAPISGLRDRCHGRSAISRACASVQKRPWHRFQGSATVVTAVRQFREHAQASRNGPGTDFRAPRPLSRPFGNFASMRKRPETALAPISGLRDRCHGRSAISRACASVQKRPWHRFQGSATVVTAVRQFREHAQASRNGPGTDFRAPRPLSRPFGNFASMRKRPETALAPISGLRDRCHGRSAISRACASVQKRPWHRFQGSATVVTAVRQFREHAQASRNGPGTDFRAPRPLSRPFGNFASMRKRPETALAPISGLRDRCHGRSAISRACASVQKRPWHRFQGSATVVTAVRQFREHAQASRNGPGTDFRAPRPLSRPFGNFASMRKRPETALAPISGLRDRCHGRSAISRACASVQKRPWHRFQGSATVVTAVRQFREHAQASRNGPGTDFRAPRPLSRPFGNFASMRKRPETALAPIWGWGWGWGWIRLAAPCRYFCFWRS